LQRKTSVTERKGKGQPIRWGKREFIKKTSFRKRSSNRFRKKTTSSKGGEGGSGCFTTRTVAPSKKGKKEILLTTGKNDNNYTPELRRGRECPDGGGGRTCFLRAKR